MARPRNQADPRVRRTRQLLLDAFMALLDEKKSPRAISVQEIARRATLNPATFYDHFADKDAFLDCWMREKFRQALARRLPPPSTLSQDTLRLLILTDLEFLAEVYRHVKPPQARADPLFETAVQEELYAVLATWLHQATAETPPQPELLESAAQVSSWAIFGAAVQWSRGARTCTADEMSRRILTVVTTGLSSIIDPASHDAPLRRDP